VQKESVVDDCAVEQPMDVEHPIAVEQPAVVEQPAAVEQPMVVEQLAAVEQSVAVEPQSTAEQPPPTAADDSQTARDTVLPDTEAELDHSDSHATSPQPPSTTERIVTKPESTAALPQSLI
jgi:hypothetical protein